MLFLSERLFAAVLLAGLMAGCARRPDVPEADSAEYRELVQSFYTGLAGLEGGEDIHAKEGLTRATQLAPGEPSAWVDLGLLAMRQQELDTAYADMQTAQALAPGDSRIEFFLGDIESRRGRLQEAARHFGRAIELDSGNVKALYALAAQTERDNAKSGGVEALKFLQRILALQPENTAVWLETARLAARTGDTALLGRAVEMLAGQSASWPDDARERMESVRKAASGPNPAGAALQVAYLRNVLVREPSYRKSMDAVKTPATSLGDPFRRFVNLPSPSPSPAEPDRKLTFEAAGWLDGASAGAASWVRAVYLDDVGPAALLWADAKGLHLGTGSTPAVDVENISPAHRDSVAVADLNYDFRSDLVIAGAGVRILEQSSGGRFSDVTARAGLPAQIREGSYNGAWPLDVDLDGDLDVVLGAVHADPVVLRNNADGTFAVLRPFKGTTDVRALSAADVDGDGDPDVAMIGSDGKLAIFANDRLGAYHARALPDGVTRAAAVAAADIDANGSPDFVVWQPDGALVRLSDQDNGAAWTTARLAETGQPGPDATLDVADLDNNGALDLVLDNGEIYLGGAAGFSRLEAAPAARLPSPADLNGDGRLDLAALSADGSPVRLLNHGTRNYHWQVIRTRAAKATGDQRINSFALGSEIEIRAGLLTEKQITTSPVTHFGLGTQTAVNYARIVWPNGLVQTEFDLRADQAVHAAQRLKGSCPSLFAWDGKQMSFVKDGAPWSPALGLHINAQQVAGIYQTEEWFKIPGGQLAARDGSYDLRVTAELWEVYYIDHYALIVVDHPDGTEVYADERFAIPPPALAVHVTGPPHSFARATDDTGNDVATTVREIDGRYLDTFGRGRYQGLTRGHWVELTLPPDAPTDTPLLLIADGWVHPTDATTNIAMSQTSLAPPQGLRIEVPDASGRWMVARNGLGFPAGKLKTSVLDLTGVFQPNAPRKLRLATNMEIYWDRLAWATAAPQTPLDTKRLQPASAELRHRGFSVMQSANASSPEIPDYDRIEATGQRWRDLEGFYTRYGDVRELLASVDDRYVIVNAGDEIRLLFPAQPPPPEGWVRDYIMIGDGWIKDGDYNSTFSKTVLPLPYHAMKDYETAPGRLEDDPTYRFHPGDWRRYHTRYVAPDSFRQGLWSRAAQR